MPGRLSAVQCHNETSCSAALIIVCVCVCVCVCSHLASKGNGLNHIIILFSAVSHFKKKSNRFSFLEPLQRFQVLTGNETLTNLGSVSILAEFTPHPINPGWYLPFISVFRCLNKYHVYLNYWRTNCKYTGHIVTSRWVGPLRGKVLEAFLLRMFYNWTTFLVTPALSFQVEQMFISKFKDIALEACHDFQERLEELL